MAVPNARAGPFESVEDSPFLRAQINAMEKEVDELRDKTLKLAKDCGKYRDGLEDAYARELNFSESLKGFYGSLEDAFACEVGGAVIERFTTAVQEIADARAALLTHVERDLCGALHRLATTELDDARDARKRFDKALNNYERSRARFMSLTRDAKPESLKAAEEDVKATRRAFETDRFHLMAQLHKVTSRKKVEFKRRLAGAMHAHLRFFDVGHDTLRELEPFSEEVLRRCDEDEREAASEATQLATAMAEYHARVTRETGAEAPSHADAFSMTSDRSRVMAAVMRDAVDANANACASEAAAVEGQMIAGSVGRRGSSLDGTRNVIINARHRRGDSREGGFELLGGDDDDDGGERDDDGASAARPPHSRRTHSRSDSLGGNVAVLTQGYLLKRSGNMRADWKRRFFVLDALGHLTYYRGAISLHWSPYDPVGVVNAVS